MHGVIMKLRYSIILFPEIGKFGIILFYLQHRLPLIYSYIVVPRLHFREAVGQTN